MDLPSLTSELRSLVEKVEGSYLAVVLDRRSRQKLLDWWEDETRKPLLAKTHAHHVTLKYEPSDDELKKVALGKHVTFAVTGWAADAKAQAVRVELNLPTAAPIPHVTLSVASGVLPAYSNTLLAGGVTPAARVLLHGTIEHVTPDD